MKLGPVTKLYKNNLKKMMMTFMATNYDVIVIFPIWSNAEARF